MNSTFIEKLPGEIITFSTRDESNEAIDKNRRYSQILEIMVEMDKPMTAKEIAVEMYKRGYIPTTERNFTGPRLTELSQIGKVEPYNKKICQFTGKKVATYILRKGEGE